MKTTASTKTKKKRKKTKTTRIGAKLLAAFLLLLAGGMFASSAAADKKKKEKKQPAAFAVIAGTVFRAPGFALPGAEVLLKADPANTGPKLKDSRVVANPRGEFAFRVPAAPSKYKVTASAPGLEPQEKEVQIDGEQRFDLTFRLEPPATK